MKTSIHIENKIRPKASRNGLKYHIKTFGCQMNEHDSEKIAGIFNNDGMTKSDDIDNADVPVSYTHLTLPTRIRV